MPTVVHTITHDMPLHQLTPLAESITELSSRMLSDTKEPDLLLIWKMISTADDLVDSPSDLDILAKCATILLDLAYRANCRPINLIKRVAELHQANMDRLTSAQNEGGGSKRTSLTTTPPVTQKWQAGSS